MDLGNTTETQVTVESVGSNSVKRVVEALVRLTTTDRAVERILTIHTRLFARYQHRIPAFKFLQTFIIDEIRGIAEAGFFFQAEDGIRDGRVTGVKTCALPI